MRTALALGLVLTLACAAGAESDPQFPTPPALAPAVRFWVDVFTRYSIDDVILHDRAQPWVIYQVLRDSDDEATQARARALDDRLRLEELTAPPPGFFASRPLAPPVDTERVRGQRGMREVIADGLLAKRLYRDTVEAALSREELPAALAVVPLIESAYHPNAISSAGAVGLWQLTEETGRPYLRVGGAFDERRDPVRSSAAAARHLRRLRDLLPSWPLALTAYNRGLAGVQRARSGAGSDDLGVIVARFREPGFGFASRNFYAEFLAALHVCTNVERYFPKLAPARMVEYQVKRGDTLYGVARRHGVSLTMLRAKNGLRTATLRPGQRLLIQL